jgi:hypothetical protein
VMNSRVSAAWLADAAATGNRRTRWGSITRAACRSSYIAQHSIAWHSRAQHGMRRVRLGASLAEATSRKR